VAGVVAVVVVAVAVVAVGLGVGSAPVEPPAPTRAPDVVAVAVSHGARVEDVATGFAAAPGRVVTVAHALDAGATVTVRGPSGRPRGARVLRVDAARDLAVLAVAPRHERTPRTGTATGPVRLVVRRGARVRSLHARVRRHITANVRDPAGGPARTRPALEIEADVEVGDSGAPVLAPDGRVVGVLFARSDRLPRTAYAVDGSELRSVLGAAG
jgi:S1-C subfamily serine protease